MKSGSVKGILFAIVSGVVQFAYAASGPGEQDGLKSFTARNDNGHCILEWNMLTKGDCVSFDLQKSTDGITYTSISQVNASEAKQADSHYMLLDNAPVTAKTYYRILEIKRNGSFTYSSIIPSIRPLEVDVAAR